MRNILNIKVNNVCDCTCFENIDNGANQIVVNYGCKNPINPKIEINGVAHLLNKTMTYDISFDLFVNNKIVFRFIDDDYKGMMFTIHDCRSQNRSYVTDKLIRISAYDYNLISKSTVDISSLGISDGLNVNENGDLVIENAQELQALADNYEELEELIENTATTTVLDHIGLSSNTDGYLIKAEFVYYEEDEDGIPVADPDTGEVTYTRNTYNLSYDSDGKLVQFNDTPIMWN